MDAFVEVESAQALLTAVLLNILQLTGYTLHTGVCSADKRQTCLLWSAPPSALGSSSGHVDGGGDSHVLGFSNIPKPAASCVSVWNPKPQLIWPHLTLK